MIVKRAVRTGRLVPDRLVVVVAIDVAYSLGMHIALLLEDPLQVNVVTIECAMLLAEACRSERWNVGIPSYSTARRVGAAEMRLLRDGI